MLSGNVFAEVESKLARKHNAKQHVITAYIQFTRHSALPLPTYSLPGKMPCAKKAAPKTSIYQSLRADSEHRDYRTARVLRVYTMQLSPWASLIAQLAKNPPAMRRPRFDSWDGKIPWRRDRLPTPVFLGFPSGSAGKESPCNVGDLGSIPGMGRSPRGGHGNPLQYSCLENSHSQVTWGPWGRKESDMTERLSLHFSSHNLQKYLACNGKKRD